MHGFRSSITAKITLVVLLGTTLVLAFVLVYSAYYSKQIIMSHAKDTAANQVKLLAERIEAELTGIEAVAKNLAFAVQYGEWNEESINGLLNRTVDSNSNIYGSAIAFEPYAFTSDLKAYGPYFCKGPQHFVQLGTDSYNYFEKDWFRIPVDNKKSIWTEPYFDEGGGEVAMITFSCPFYESKTAEPQQTVKGVITADVSLEMLSDILWSSKFDDTQDTVFIVSKHGVVLACPDKYLILKQSVYNIAGKAMDGSLKLIGKEIEEKKEGFLAVQKSALIPEDGFFFFCRMAKRDWIVCSVPATKDVSKELTGLHISIGLMAGIGTLALLAVSVVIAKSISKPLRTMADATRRVAEGDLNIDLSQLRRQDEVGQLGEAFEKMAKDLKKHIQELTDTIAAKQKIESELSIAAQIQQDMLPSDFPAFPNRTEFDIHAIMRPAKMVGGDFYDFLMLNDHKICIVVADVSDKGVPAALLMSVTKYLVEAFLQNNPEPGEILKRVNTQLLRGNESCMFVTIVVGILDLKTGEFVYASGGHNPLLLICPDGSSHFLGRPGGPVLGLIEDADFDVDRLMLQPNCSIVAYTDGVTEAFSADGDQFLESRLFDCAVAGVDLSAGEITSSIVEAVDSFCTGAPQADDITVLTLKFHHKMKITD